MLQLISGFWISRCIYVAAKLGIADLLNNGPKSADELATATGADAPSLFRVLRALAAVGIVTQGKDNRFSSTSLLETLRSDTPGSLRAFAMTELGEEHYPAWGELLHSVRTGGIAFDQAFGMPVWEFFGKNPNNAKIFNDEPFGPVAAIQPFDTLEAAITESNRLPIGLAGYAFTKSLKNSDLLARKLEVGMLWMNMPAMPSAEMPFGGVKDSGYGSEGGPEALEAYLNSRAVVIANA